MILYNNPYLNNPYVSSIAGIAILMIGLFVLFKNYKSRLYNIFFLTCFGLFVWFTGNSFSMYYYADYETALLWFRIAYSGVPFISLSIFHLYKYMSNESKKVIFILYVITFAELIYLWFNNIVREGLYFLPYVGGVWEGMPFFSYFLLFGMLKYAIMLLLTVISSYRAYKKESNMFRKQQYKVFLITTIFYVGGIIEWLVIFGIPLHIAWIVLPPICFLYAYNIIRNRFMDIETAVHKTIGWIVMSILVFFPILILNLFVGNTLTRLEIWQYSLVYGVGAFFLIRYYNYVQPKIDRFFRRRAYDFEEKKNALIKKASGIIQIEKMLEVLSIEIPNLFYSRNAAVYVFDSNKFIGRDSSTQKKIIKSDELINLIKNIQKPIRLSDCPNASEKEINFCGWMKSNDCEIFIPIVQSDQYVGFIVLGKKDSLQEYKDIEIELLNQLAYGLSIPIMNTLEHEKLMLSEIETRKELQKFNVELEKKVEERTRSIVKKDNKITQINKRLKTANKRLKEMDMKKDEFISLAAHELKTPLTSIRGFAQLMKNKKIINDAATNSHYLDLINKNTERLYNLVLDLVDSSRINIGKLKMNFEVVDIKIIFNEVRENMAFIIKDKGIKPVFSIEKNLPSVWADSARLLQVLKNLIINAIHYTEKGAISLKIRKDKKFILFEVKDTGGGIPEDAKKEIFSRFYQVDTSLTRRIGGSGLGLSVCQGLVELMGGKIWFDSEIGKGTTFYFTIPIVEDN